MEKIVFKSATAADVPVLRSFAVQSEAIWGSGEDFLCRFNDEYNVTEDFVRDNVVFILLEDGEIRGFWGAIPNGRQAELEYLYVAAAQIRKGYGKMLWDHMTGWCGANGINRVDLVTSQPAVGFYLKAGAVLDGGTRPPVDGREIPRLHYDIV